MAGRPRLADWEVDEMLLMLRRGASVAEVAARFRLSERTVQRYVKRAREEEGGNE